MKEYPSKESKTVNYRNRSNVELPGFLFGLHTIESRKYDGIVTYIQLPQGAQGPNGLRWGLRIGNYNTLIFCNDYDQPYIKYEGDKYTYYYLTKEGKVVEATGNVNKPAYLEETKIVGELPNVVNILKEEGLF